MWFVNGYIMGYLHLSLILELNLLLMRILIWLKVYQAWKLWGVDKGPTNVMMQTEDGHVFSVSLSESKGKLFFFHGWSNVVIHLRLTKGCLVVFNPVDSTTFKVTYFLDGVIPECILPKTYDYTSNDLISTVIIDNKTFHVIIETADGKVGFTVGIDLIVSLLQLEVGCFFYL
ncbi:putative transcription factor B3-Domain family [Helianthus annuus]|nr:putative transcription factor B3-Domain family [Helianthus annuus]